MKKTDTKTLIEAMRILARDIQSEDGVASAAISEAADRLEELQAQHRKDDDEYAKLWQMYGDLEEERDQLQNALMNLIAASERECRSDSVLRKFLLPHCKAARKVLQEADDE